MLEIAIFTLVALLAICGLAWHEQSTSPAVIERRRANPKQSSSE